MVNRKVGELGKQVLWFEINLTQAIITMMWSCTLIYGSMALSLLRKDEDLPLRFASKIWAPFLLKGAGVRVKLYSAKKIFSQPIFIASTHHSIMDIPILFKALPMPVRFIVKKELSFFPCLGCFVLGTGMITVTKKSFQDKVSAFSKVERLLKKGKNVVCFPSATRTPENKFTFHSFFFEVPFRLNVPILPVKIEGSSKVIPVGTFKVRPSIVKVKLGTEIYPNEFSNRKEMTSHILKTVKDL